MYGASRYRLQRCSLLGSWSNSPLTTPDSATIALCAGGSQQRRCYYILLSLWSIHISTLPDVWCPILGKPDTPLCRLADRHGRKAGLNWKLQISNKADNADITHSQARDTRNRRIQEVNSLCTDSPALRAEYCIVAFHTICSHLVFGCFWNRIPVIVLTLRHIQTQPTDSTLRPQSVRYRPR